MRARLDDDSGLDCFLDIPLLDLDSPRLDCNHMRCHMWSRNRTWARLDCCTISIASSRLDCTRMLGNLD